MAHTTYDYDNQAYLVDGVYQDCNHPDTMDCKCYGRVNKGKSEGDHRLVRVVSSQADALSYKVTPKTVYGNKLYYPVCEFAQLVCDLTQSKTITTHTMQRLYAEGYEPLCVDADGNLLDSDKWVKAFPIGDRMFFE